MSEKNLLQPVIAFSNGSEEGAVSCPFCGGEARITYVNDAPFAGCENKSCPAHNFDAIPLAAWNKREPLRKPPAAELCPFCGSIPDRWYVEGEEEYFARCRNPKCEAAMFPGISLGAWNTRPIEDALNARIAELEAERRWIPVSERLPEDGREVLVLVEELITAGAHYQFGAAFNDDDVLVETPTWVLGLEEETYGFDAYAAVTHWMPLPEPPEVK